MFRSGKWKVYPHGRSEYPEAVSGYHGNIDGFTCSCRVLLPTSSGPIPITLMSSKVTPSNILASACTQSHTNVAVFFLPDMCGVLLPVVFLTSTRCYQICNLPCVHIPGMRVTYYNCIVVFLVAFSILMHSLHWPFLLTCDLDNLDLDQTCFGYVFQMKSLKITHFVLTTINSFAFEK